MVKAPYNFVPLNEDVFFPEWADYISHDVPFKEGKSGKIELTITAESPIFIRGREEAYPNGGEWKQYRFPKFDKKNYIPGSSIRGMLAHQLEIISFGKLQHFNDDQHSYRDWENEKLYNKSQFSNNKCGWLYKNSSGCFCIQGDQKIIRINHKEIDKASGTDFHDFFTGNEINSVKYDEKSDEHKTAKFKYERHLSCSESLVLKVSEANTEDRRTIYKANQEGEEKTLVLTGQSSKRNSFSEKGKHLEFLFPMFNANLSENFKLENDKGEPLSVYEDFLRTYDGAVDWKFWKEKLKNNEPVPVFYEERGNGVKSIGLSMLYKLSYKKSVGQLIEEQSPKHVDNCKWDLAECIFGSVSGKTSLKGRVEISHAFSSNGEETNSEEPTIITLGGPKSSYYPFYIEQKNIDANANCKGSLKGSLDNKGKHSGTYKTYNDGNIAGRKKYPVKGWFTKTENAEMSSTTSAFFPLKTGTTFTTTLCYHNLLPHELGAILSTLTFHNSPNCRHQMGTAKALGYGKIHVEIDYEKSNLIENNALKYMACFEKTMNQANVVSGDWHLSEQIKENLALSTPISFNDHIDAYLNLIPDESINEFSDLKSNRNGNVPKGLPRFTAFMGITELQINSLTNGVECKQNDLNWSSVNNPTGERCQQISDQLKKIELRLIKIPEENRQKLILQEAEDVKRKRREEIDKSNRVLGDSARNTPLGEIILELPNKLKALTEKVDEFLKRRGETNLPENEHPILIEKLSQLYRVSSKQPRWSKPYNNNIVLKTVAKWVGKENAIQYIEQIVNQK